MHHKVGVLTFGKTSEDAYEHALKVMNDNTGEDFDKFDYFSEPLSEHSRYDLHKAVEIPPLIPFSETHIQEEAISLLKATQDNFWSWYDRAEKRNKLETRSELNSKGVNDMHTECSIGSAKSQAFLLDHDGEVVIARDTFNKILNKWESVYKKGDNPYKEDKVYMSTFDAHT